MSPCRTLLVIVEDLPKLKVLYDIDTKFIQTVVLIKQPGEKIPEKSGIKVVMWDDAMKTDVKLEVITPQPGDLATINYTSGTSGKPKGVMLSHKSSAVCALSYAMVLPVPATTNDVWFSYLPMAHVFERTVHIIMMYTGAKCAFSSGNLRQINQELGLARPTFFGAVPRTLNKLYEKVNETISAPGKVRTSNNLGPRDLSRKLEAQVFSNNYVCNL